MNSIQNCFLLHCFLIDINECKDLPDACHKDAYCSNYDGSYNCTCVSGYSGNGTVCIGGYHVMNKVKVVVCVFRQQWVHSLCVDLGLSRPN